MTTITITQTFTSKTRNAGGGGGIPPSNTVAPVISGTAVVGQTLSSTTGTWTGTPIPTYTYQWKRNGSNIVSATSSTYTLVQADATFAITCAVTAINIAGSAEATSNSLTITDADAQAFFTASGLTGATNLTAINNLVVALKGFGIWTKMKAIYPMIGGTAALHKWNLKDPQDTNAAFRLVFNGGWTHSATGALPNGTNAWANTFLGTNVMSLNSIHLSYYSRTNNTSGTVEMGVLKSTPNSYTDLGVGYLTNGAFTRLNNGGGAPFVANAGSNGFFQGNRIISSTTKLYKNGISIQTLTDTSSATTTFPISIGAQNNIDTGTKNFYSDKQCAFATIGDGLTDTEAANFYTAVQAYQTTLSRQV